MVLNTTARTVPTIWRQPYLGRVGRADQMVSRRGDEW